MLEKLLHQEIQEKGPLSQSRFMELALQHPLYGYYRSQEAVSRDFTTSPEISQMFGELLGAWAIDCYTKLKEPQALTLVELGPGKGTLMADFLRVAKQSNPFYRALHLYLLEINPLLKELQQRNILFPTATNHNQPVIATPQSGQNNPENCPPPGLLRSVPNDELDISSPPTHWIETLGEIPLSDDPLIIIANEFFDVLPTHFYMRQDNVLFERCIGIQEDKITFTFLPLRPDPGPDYTWEESFDTEAIIHDICFKLLKKKGFFICIDYGYEQGAADSLQALFQGEPSNPLTHIGKSDLTCQVNFGKIKEIAYSHGLDVYGPLPQGQFLKTMGLNIRLEKLKQSNPSQKASLDIAATRLTHPQQMGELFKVIIISSLTGYPL